MRAAITLPDADAPAQLKQAGKQEYTEFRGGGGGGASKAEAPGFAGRLLLKTNIVEKQLGAAIGGGCEQCDRLDTSDIK